MIGTFEYIRDNLYIPYMFSKKTTDLCITTECNYNVSIVFINHQKAVY
jgi:hypothetical protein